MEYNVFRVTYRMEIYVAAKSIDDAKTKFENLSVADMELAEFVEVVDIESIN